MREAKWNFDQVMVLTEQSRQDVGWWLENIPYSGKPLRWPKPQVTMYADTSNKGWGAHTDTEADAAGGRWSDQEKAISMSISKGCTASVK